MRVIGGLARLLHADDACLIAVDDWCEHGRHRAEFKSVAYATRALPEGHKYICELTCYHNNNYVSATGTGAHTGDAFVAALKQMELTIGLEWRRPTK